MSASLEHSVHVKQTQKNVHYMYICMYVCMNSKTDKTDQWGEVKIVMTRGRSNC